MTDKTPAIIKWLTSLDVLKYSQFTIDWVERILDNYNVMAEEGNAPPDNEITEAIKYEAQNILQVINLRLLDATFFKQVLRHEGQSPRQGQVG